MPDRDVEIRNAVLHLIEGLTGRKADTYDVDFVLGSLAGDGFRLVRAVDSEADRG